MTANNTMTLRAHGEHSPDRITHRKGHRERV